MCEPMQDFYGENIKAEDDTNSQNFLTGHSIRLCLCRLSFFPVYFSLSYVFCPLSSYFSLSLLLKMILICKLFTLAILQHRRPLSLNKQKHRKVLFSENFYKHLTGICPKRFFCEISLFLDSCIST